MRNKTTEEIEQLAILRYGNDPNSYGGQRDGFMNGYTICQETLNARILELEAKLSVYDLNLKDIVESKDAIIRELQKKTDLIVNMSVNDVLNMIDEFRVKELPNRNEPYHYEAEIESGLKHFEVFIKGKQPKINLKKLKK